MMDSLSDSDGGRLLSIGLVALAVGAFVVYDQFDKKAHYLPVQARISRVDEVCYMEKKVGRSTTTSDTLGCNAALQAVKTHPKWQGFAVKYKINVEYEYTSPVDNRTHSGKRMMSGWPDGKRLYPGQLFEIRASRTDPEQTREI